MTKIPTQQVKKLAAEYGLTLRQVSAASHLPDDEHYRRSYVAKGLAVDLDERSEAVCLSTSHNSPQTEESEGSEAFVSRKTSDLFLGNNGKLGAHIEFYTEATGARVQREYRLVSCGCCGEAVKVPAYRSPKNVVCVRCRRGLNDAGQNAFRLAKENGADIEPEKQYKRQAGDIVGFSSGSRRRLMRYFQGVKKGTTVNFCTATLPDEFYFFVREELEKNAAAAAKESDSTPESVTHEMVLTSLGFVFRRMIDALGKRFLRRFPEGSFIWRMEDETRKTGVWQGERFPHGHIATLGIGYKEMAAFFADAWYDLVGHGSKDAKWFNSVERAKAVQKMRSRKEMMGYISKAVAHVISGEMGKETQVSDAFPGRKWGIVGRENLPLYISEKEIVDLRDSQCPELIRAFGELIRGQIYQKEVKFRRKYRARAGIPKKRAKNKRSFAALQIAIDPENVLKLLTPQGERVYRATGRKRETPFFVHAYEMGWLKP